VSAAKGPVAGTTDVTQADNTGGTRHGRTPARKTSHVA
jgi:hypothetical protein